MLRPDATQRADHVFARTFAIYVGTAGLLIGTISLLGTYYWASPIWHVRVNQLGQLDGPRLGLLFEGIRLFLVVVLGLATLCWGFPEEVAALLRFRSIGDGRRRRAAQQPSGETPPESRGPERRGFWRSERASIFAFRISLLLVLIAMCIWKDSEVFYRGPNTPPARLLEWGMAPRTDEPVAAAESSTDDGGGVIGDRELTYAQLSRHVESIRTTFVWYLPYSLVSYAFIVPLVFVIPLYSAVCTDRGKLQLYSFHRLLAAHASSDDIYTGLKNIQGRCQQASQRYLYLCAALGVVFLYTQFDPTLTAGTRGVLRYVFYVLVGGSALAVLKLWGHYYATWQLTLNHLVQRCECTDAVQEELSPLTFGRKLVMQTPQGIVAAALISPTVQEMLGKFIGT